MKKRKKHLPNKFRNHGLHIWCTKCKKTVTAKPCNHADQQKFQSRVWNPFTGKQDCIKSYKTEDPQEAFNLHLDYKEELRRNNFDLKFEDDTDTIPIPKFLKESAQLYLDYLEDLDVPEYEKKNLSKQYLNDQSRYIKRFLKVVQSIEGKISSFQVKLLSKKHVSGFDHYIKTLKLSDRSYNVHMKSVRYFIDYLINKKNVPMTNPFSDVKLRTLVYNPEIITQDEFQTFLNTITEENGLTHIGKIKKKVQYFRPWLPLVYKFALLTGERLDGVVRLKWKDVKDNYIAIPNWKVNRIKNTDVYNSYTPITKDLAEILLEIPTGDPEDYILLAEKKNRNQLKSFISKAFSHYWTKSQIEKNVTFKHLRKTYITKMVDLIGEKAKLIKHTNDTTVIKHYLAEKEILEDLRNVEMFKLK